MLTRREIKDKREKIKEYKQKEREGQSRQKKVWIRKKDRERERTVQIKARKCKDKLTGVSPKTTLNRVSTVRKTLPKAPQQYADVVSNLITNCSPRKCQALFTIKQQTNSYVF